MCERKYEFARIPLRTKIRDACGVIFRDADMREMLFTVIDGAVEDFLDNHIIYEDQGVDEYAIVFR